MSGCHTWRDSVTPGLLCAWWGSFRWGVAPLDADDALAQAADDLAIQRPILLARDLRQRLVNFGGHPHADGAELSLSCSHGDHSSPIVAHDG